MILCRITGVVWSTRKNEQLEGNRLLICQPVELDGKTPLGSSFLALDRVDAGEGELVLVNAEGGGARITLGNDQIPLRYLIVAVVDELELVK